MLILHLEMALPPTTKEGEEARKKNKTGAQIVHQPNTGTQTHTDKGKQQAPHST